MSEQKSKETCWLFYYFCCVQLRKLAAEPTSSSFSMPKNLPNSAYSKYPSLLSCLLSLWRRFTFIIDGNERACGPTTIEDHIFLIGFLSKDTFTRICSRMNNKVLKAFGHKIHPRLRKPNQELWCRPKASSVTNYVCLMKIIGLIGSHVRKTCM